MKKRVTVIGGGIIGACSAWELSKAGFEVTLIEKGGIASAASGGNLGQISILDRTEAWHLKLVLDSMEIYRNLTKKYSFGFSQCGGTANLENAEDIEKAEKIVKLLEEKEVHCGFYMGQEIKKVQPMLENPDVLGVVKCEEEGVINPLMTVSMFLSLAEKRGAVVMEHTKVTSFQREYGRVTAVITDRGRVETDYVVCAAGAWTADLAKCLNSRVNLDYRRGTAMVSKKMPPMIYGQVSGHEIFGGSLEEHGTQKISMGASQTMDGTILIAQATEESELNSKEITATGICRMAKRFLSYFPELKDLEIVRMWAAVTPLSQDGKPFFGFLKNAENVLITAGFKGAFSTAPAIARHVTEYVEGNYSWDNQEFIPERAV